MFRDNQPFTPHFGGGGGGNVYAECVEVGKLVAWRSGAERMCVCLVRGESGREIRGKGKKGGAGRIV